MRRWKSTATHKPKPDVRYWTLDEDGFVAIGYSNTNDEMEDREYDWSYDCGENGCCYNAIRILYFCEVESEPIAPRGFKPRVDESSRSVDVLRPSNGKPHSLPKGEPQ